MLISLAQVSKSMDIHEGDHVLIEERDGGVFIKTVGWHNKSQEYICLRNGKIVLNPVK